MPASVCLPLPARSLAVSLPIPMLAPVIIAVFPSRRTSEDHLVTNTDLKSEVSKGQVIREILRGILTPNMMEKSNSYRQQNKNNFVRKMKGINYCLCNMFV